MKKINSKGMMQGAIALSIAAFIAKILSAVYRVPFQNMVGNTGFYVYQQVYPIYGIGMTFALTGFPVFVSNVVAEYLESTYDVVKRTDNRRYLLFHLLLVLQWKSAK